MADPAPTYEITPTPFPAPTKTTSTSIRNIETTASCTHFSDKIVITVTQGGRLAHWIHVPLALSPTDSSTILPTSSSSDDHTLLPQPSLTATSILGSPSDSLSTLAQTLAAQIGSAIKSQNAREERTLVLGVGFDKDLLSFSPSSNTNGAGAGAGGTAAGREEYAELVGLVLDVL